MQNLQISLYFPTVHSKSLRKGFPYVHQVASHAASSINAVVWHPNRETFYTFCSVDWHLEILNCFKGKDDFMLAALFSECSFCKHLEIHIFDSSI